MQVNSHNIRQIRGGLMQVDITITVGQISGGVIQVNSHNIRLGVALCR